MCPKGSTRSRRKHSRHEGCYHTNLHHRPGFCLVTIRDKNREISMVDAALSGGLRRQRLGGFGSGPTSSRVSPNETVIFPSVVSFTSSDLARTTVASFTRPERCA